MRAFSKLLAFSDEVLGALFVDVLPELLRSIVLAIYILWKQWKHIRWSHKYSSIIKKKSLNFAVSCSCSDQKWKECSICLSELAEGEEATELVDCGHVFHRRCVERWVRWQRATCPLCRSVVVPEVVVTEYHRARLDRHTDLIQKELALILLKVLHAGTCPHGSF